MTDLQMQMNGNYRMINQTTLSINEGYNNLYL